MADTATSTAAPSNTNETNTKPKSKEERMKKRRFGGQQDGARKKRKLNHEIDLTKSRNIILCSCQKYKEKMCGRDLKLVFTEYIEEYLKQKKEKKEKNEKDEENEDDDLKNKKTDNNDKNENDEEKKEDKTAKEEHDDDDDEDDDLKDNKNNKNDGISISDAINKELSDLNCNEHCEWIQGPDGLVIVDILNKNVKASELLQFVFDKFHPNRPNLSPFIYKLFPLDCTTFSRSEDMIDLGQKMINNQNWDKISTDHRYAINYKNRGNKKLDRNTIIKGIASFVPKQYSVDLNNPKTVILLQTFGRTAGISIITNSVFTKHKEYNMGNFEDE